MPGICGSVRLLECTRSNRPIKPLISDIRDHAERLLQLLKHGARLHGSGLDRANRVGGHGNALAVSTAGMEARQPKSRGVRCMRQLHGM